MPLQLANSFFVLCFVVSFISSAEAVRLNRKFTSTAELASHASGSASKEAKSESTFGKVTLPTGQQLIKAIRGRESCFKGIQIGKRLGSGAVSEGVFMAKDSTHGLVALKIQDIDFLSPELQIAAKPESRLDSDDEDFDLPLLLPLLAKKTINDFKGFVAEVNAQAKAASLGLSIPVLDVWICEHAYKKDLAVAYFTMPIVKGRELSHAINKNNNEEELAVSSNEKSFCGNCGSQDCKWVKCYQRYMGPGVTSVNGHITTFDLSRFRLGIEILEKNKILTEDFHPGNVMVDEKGNIIFIDFGRIGEGDTDAQWAFRRSGCPRNDANINVESLDCP